MAIQHARHDHFDFDNSDRKHHNDKDSFEIARPQEKVLGETIGDWTDDWWTWVLQNSATENPADDITGEWADDNNDGPVYFLAGTFFNKPVERTFEVPDDTPILVPLLNTVSIKFEDDEQPQGEIINEELEDWQDTVKEYSLFLSIDGVEVKHLDRFYFKSDFFSPGPPNDSSLLAAFEPPPGDDLFPSRSAGYWVMIEDLSPGEHTISYGGETTGGQLVDVTNHIFIA